MASATVKNDTVILWYDSGRLIRTLMIFDPIEMEDPEDDWYYNTNTYYNNADGANTAATSSTGGTIKESTPTPVVTNLSPR